MASSPLAIVRHYWFPGLPEDHCGPALGGGFSGSPVVAVRTPAGSGAVLKAFAPGTSLERAVWIHGFMDHLTASGITQVPRLLPALDQHSLAVDADGTLWELATHMPGAAQTRPTAGQVAAAMASLARLHEASARWQREPPRCGPAPAIVRRIAAARELLADPWDRASRPVGRLEAVPDPLRGWCAARRELLARATDRARLRRVLGAIASLEPAPALLQAVVRDLRADHVLFTAIKSDHADAVSGIVDFHGAAIDTPATDIARLLGDWATGARGVAWGDCWDSALDAYGRVRPLRADQRALVPWLAATAVVFGLDRWFRWILDENRSFAASGLVEARIDRLLQQLPQAFDLLEDLPLPRPNAGGESV
ncbi:MAG: phosphotransferase enzyme family protein [Planctomycetota bacterium]